MAVREKQPKSTNTGNAVKRRKRTQRVYTSAVAVLSTCSIAYAIDMNTRADQGDAAHLKATKLATYSGSLDAHIARTESQYRDLLAQYNGVLTSATAQQTRMLADLRRARDDAQKARTVKLAPVTYAVQRIAGSASVSAASGGGATTGTS